MDAATRAELDALRLRAYGPSADIAGDADALRRLVVLEELALPVIARDRTAVTHPDTAPHPVAVRTAAETAGTSEARGPLLPPDRDDAPVDARVVAVLPASDPHRRRRRRSAWHVAFVAAVALVTVPLGSTAALHTEPDAVPSAIAGEIPTSVREALAFVRDPQADVLIRVRIDGSFGDYVDIPVGDDVPPFPANGAMRWVEALGDYYGWKLWIGGATGALDDENCLLLEGEATLRGNCLATELKTQGALILSVPFAEVAPEERPDAMAREQSLGFWWGPDGVVTILLSPTPAD